MLVLNIKAIVDLPEVLGVEARIEKLEMAVEDLRKPDLLVESKGGSDYYFRQNE